MSRMLWRAVGAELQQQGDRPGYGCSPSGCGTEARGPASLRWANVSQLLPWVHEWLQCRIIASDLEFLILSLQDSNTLPPLSLEASAAAGATQDDEPPVDPATQPDSNSGGPSSQTKIGGALQAVGRRIPLQVITFVPLL